MLDLMIAIELLDTPDEIIHGQKVCDLRKNVLTCIHKEMYSITEKTVQIV